MHRLAACARPEGRGKLTMVASFARISSFVCALALAACSATDVVARGAAARGAGGCTPVGCSTLTTQAALCQGKDEHALAGDSCDANAQVTRYALCTCSDLVSHSTLSVDSFSGTLTQSARRRPQLGINGNLSLTGQGTLDADLIVQGKSELGPDLSARAPVESANAPCQCAPSALLDIPAMVSARAGDNENQAASISSDQLNGFRGAQQLTLVCGRYYFTRFKGDDPIVIRTRGDVAIFVGSNIELNDALSIQTETESHVSLFVAGDMRVGGALSLGGDPNGKARVDLYLASEGTLEVAGSVDITGKLYAPRAELVSFGTFQLYGSLFVRRAAPGADLFVHYDEQASEPKSCASLP